MRNLRIESSFPNDKRKKLMIQEWEKLDDIKCQSTCYIPDPTSIDEIHKGNTSIRSQLLFQTTQLAQMNKIV